MTTLADVEDHRATTLGLSTLAISELVNLWRELDPISDARATAQALREVLPTILTTYGLAAGSVAADFYDDMRAEVAGLAAYTSMTTDPPTDDAAQALIGWGLAPLFERDTTTSEGLVEGDGAKVDTAPAPSLERALSRLSGGVQRAVANTARQTIITNARRDPSEVRYVRHASANACAFCAVLATRQAVYRTESTKFHRSCHCVAVPVWPGDELEEPPYVADWREAYYDARNRVSNPNDLKALLAVMRDTAGLR